MQQTRLNSIVFLQNDRKRVDLFLAQTLGIPRNQIQHWIEEGNVKVNDQLINKSYKLSYNDFIIFEEFKQEPLEVNIAYADIKIVYEDEDVVVVEKPPFLVVHPGAAKEQQSVVGALLYRGIRLSDLGAPLRPGVVHRIDKDTSGIIVLAKNNCAHFKLAQAFAEHEIERMYIGFVEGNLSQWEGTIHTQIGRHPNKRKEFSVISGKIAITHYKVIKRYPNMDVVRFRLETGRTHQIRVHMKHLNHPLVGDVVYSNKISKKINRQALHAFYLGFYNPGSGKFLKFYSKLPVDMINLLS